MYIPVQPVVLKLKYEGIHLSHSAPPIPCLHVHVPEDIEQLVITSVPIGSQPQAIRTYINSLKTDKY